MTALWLFGAKVRISLCFFFQAEDGIRDLTVTGVQTCALPISTMPTAWGAALRIVRNAVFTAVVLRTYVPSATSAIERFSSAVKTPARPARPNESDRKSVV